MPLFTEINGSRPVSINLTTQKATAFRHFDCIDITPQELITAARTPAVYGLPIKHEPYPGAEELPCTKLDIRPLGFNGAIATATYGEANGGSFSQVIDLEDEFFYFWKYSTQLDTVEIPYAVASSTKILKNLDSNGVPVYDYINPMNPSAIAVLKTTSRFELRTRMRNMTFADFEAMDAETGKLHFINNKYWLYLGGTVEAKRRDESTGEYINELLHSWVRDPGTVELSSNTYLKYDTDLMPRNPLSVPTMKYNPGLGGTIYQPSQDYPPLVWYDPRADWLEGRSPQKLYTRPPFHILTASPGVIEIIDPQPGAYPFEYDPTAEPIYIPSLPFLINNNGWTGLPGALPGG
jgi:hypothetical protein